MILKISSNLYYGHQGKTKALFMKHYKKLGLKWMESIELNGKIVDGWFSSDKKEYILKLVEEGELKRFTGNSVGMIDFLKGCGAVEFEVEAVGEHINYNDNKGYITQFDRFGKFVGADLFWSYRMREILKDVPDNWNGVIWSAPKYENVVNIEKVKRKIIIRRKKL